MENTLFSSLRLLILDFKNGNREEYIIEESCIDNFISESKRIRKYKELVRIIIGEPKAVGLKWWMSPGLNKGIYEFSNFHTIWEK